MRTGVMLLAVIGLTIVIYSNSLGGDFVWDDEGFVVRNDLIKDLKNIPLFFTSRESLAKGGLAAQNYRPFLPLSFALDYKLWGLNPLGYHSVNLFLHLLNALLVFWLVLILFGDRATAALSSLIFAAHPIQTESVSWISGRSVVLFAFFYLLSLILYIRYAKGTGLLSYAASLILFAFSLLSKEAAVTLPLVLILYDIFFGGKSRLASLAVIYFSYFLILELYLIARFDILGAMGQGGYMAEGLYPTMLTMARGVAYYVKLLLFPVRLCGDYVTFRPSVSIAEAPVLGSVILLSALFLGAVLLRRRSKEFSFSVLFFFVTLAPVSNIIPMRTFIAERFLYLPSVGFAILSSTLIVRLYLRAKRRKAGGALVMAGCAALIAFYGLRTTERNLDWRDDFTFSESCLKHDPLNPRARYNLGVSYAAKGDLERASEEFKKTIALSPSFLPARESLACCHLFNNEQEAAIRELKGILKINPSYFMAYERLAVVYAQLKEYDKAFAELEKALALDEKFVQARVTLGRLYELEGKRDEAIREYENIAATKGVYHERALYAGVYLKLGELYAMMGDRDKAADMWERAARLYPEQVCFARTADFLLGRVKSPDFQVMVGSWHPEARIAALYYIGFKKEMEGDAEGASEFYKSCAEIFGRECDDIRLIALDRLERMKGEGSRGEEK